MKSFKFEAKFHNSELLEKFCKIFKYEKFRKYLKEPEIYIKKANLI